MHTHVAFAPMVKVVMETNTANTVTHFRIKEYLEFYDDLFDYLTFIQTSPRLYICDNAHSAITIHGNVWDLKHGQYRLMLRDHNMRLPEEYPGRYYAIPRN